MHQRHLPLRRSQPGDPRALDTLGSDIRLRSAIAPDRRGRDGVREVRRATRSTRGDRDDRGRRGPRRRAEIFWRNTRTLTTPAVRGDAAPDPRHCARHPPVRVRHGEPARGTDPRDQRAQLLVRETSPLRQTAAYWAGRRD